MEKNDSTNERLSFAQPNAESTMNNGTFHWGRKEFDNSTKFQERITTNKSANTNVLSKIEARVYTDVQSRGLASRVVKYHENSARLNRSMSMNNLCVKASPLSLKHPSKQPELAYKAAKQNFSMTHIAPPDKSLFYGNTLSGLLRSNSVINLQQNDDDLSSENRPIIHPPGTENEFQPSVLEVLKEISRKRINNEVLQDSDEADTTKKYCSRNDNNLSNGMPNEYRMQQQMQQLQAPTNYKRQRESATCTLDINAQQGKSQQTELPSPEQKSKRRHCNYNNDITSSLSSSTKSTAFKRKLNEYDGYKRQEKVLRYQSDTRLYELTSAHSLNNKTSITPLTNTPQIVSNDLPPLPAYVEKSVSAPAATTVNVMEKKLEPELLDKPKLTLFNKNYETNEIAETELTKELDNEVNDNDDDAYVGINFVKPKKSTTNIGNNASNLILKRTQKSKLALMLSGLRGELYLGEDEHETSAKQTNVTNDTKKEVTQTTATTLATPLMTNDNIVSSTSNQAATVDKTDAKSEKATTITSSQQTTFTTAVSFINTVSTLNAVSSTAVTTTTLATTTKTATKITSPLTGIKLTPITQTNSPQAAPKTTATILDSSISKPTFSFGLPTTTTAALQTLGSTSVLPTTVTDSTAKTHTAPTFILGATSISSTQTQAALPTTTMTALNTNAPTRTTSATTTATSTIMPVFSFTAKTQANTTANSTANCITTTTPFTFGSLQSTTKPSTVAVTNSETTKPLNTLAAPQFNFAANKNVGGFNFGNTTTASTEAPKTTNTSTLIAAPKSATENAGFSFGGNTKVFDAKTNNTINSSFGSTNTQLKFGEQSQQHKEAVSATNTFVFGAKPTANPTINTTTNTQSIGLFNLAPAANATNTVSTTEASKTSNTFTFSNVATQPKTFNFGASSNNASNTDATTKSTNLFASIGNNQSQTFNFGGTKTNNEANLTTATKPQPSNTFSFGSSSISNTIPAATEAQKAANTFSFSNANNKTNQSNTFTNNNATQSNAFVFGNPTNSTNNKTTPAEPAKTTSNVFGGASTNQTGAFTFGSVASTPNTNNAFGAASMPNNNAAFNFSTSSNNKNTAATNNNNQTSNTFGTFGSSTNSSSSTVFSFGASAGVGNVAKPTPTPAFGTSTNNNTSIGGGGGFVFGASNKNSTPAAAATATNIFGSSTPNPANTSGTGGNLFGNTHTQATGNAFGTVSSSPFGAKFPNATNDATSTTQTNPTANIFTIPPSAGNDRPIRRATRRLAKS